MDVIRISHLNSYTKYEAHDHTTIPAAAGTAVQVADRQMWNIAFCYLHKSIPNQLIHRIQAPFNTAVSTVIYMMPSSVIYVLLFFFFTVGKIHLEFSKTFPPIVWVLQEGWKRDTKPFLFLFRQAMGSWSKKRFQPLISWLRNCFLSQRERVTKEGLYAGLCKG